MFSGDAYRRDDVTTHYPDGRSDSGRPTITRGARLPLQAHVETTAFGCTVRLPVRAEHVSVEKWPVVVEEVIVHTAQVDDTVHLNETIRREELHVDTTGDVHVTDRRAGPGGVIWER
jgi:stress response protein YsnF